MSACCLPFLTPARWNCHTATICPPCSWRISPVFSGTGNSHEESKQQLWQDLFLHPSEWWDNRLSKRGPRHPDFRHKRSREPLWLNSLSKPLWVDSQLATLDARVGGLVGESSRGCCGPNDEVASLCEQGQPDKAVDALFRMDKEGTYPSVETYRSVLKACARGKALDQAKRVYEHLVNNGFEFNRYICESLVSTFVECGSLADAVQIFFSLPHRTVVSWTAVINGYSQAGQPRVALRMYFSMIDEGVCPNRYTFISLLKACGSLAEDDNTLSVLNGQAVRAESLQLAKAIHAEAGRTGCESNVFVGSTLISVYAKCGSIMDAQHVFDFLWQRNTVSWNAMLAGYVQQAQGDTALRLVFQMQEEGVSMNDRTIVSALQACGSIAEKEDAVPEDGLYLRVESLRMGKAIHAEALCKGYESDVFVGSTLISTYAKCGSSRDAEHVFDRLVQKGMVSWNALLAGYAQQGQEGKAMQLYEQMQEADVRPNERTFVSVLQACGSLAEKEDALDGRAVRVESLQAGKVIHAEAQSLGYGSDVFICNALVSVYASCGSTNDAQIVFDRLSQQNLVSWNAMLAGYAQQGQGLETVQLYDKMGEEVVSPDARTFVSLLQACGSLAEQEEVYLIDGQSIRVEALYRGKVIHAEAIRRGYESDVFVGSTLVSMYGKCGSLTDAQNVLDRLPQKHLVSRNAMLAAYIQQGESGQAVELFRHMLEHGIVPDETTYLSVLQACGNTGAFCICEQIHHSYASAGTPLSPLLGNTLIHAYGKCARMEKAHDVFDALRERNLVSWNALIAGYARQGSCDTSLQCYEQMLLAGVRPNGVTFLSLISACSHAGIVDKGIEYFESMTRDYGITPGMEHYVSMMDLFSRAGHFTTVEDLMSTMPLQPDLPMLLCLLAACRKHGNFSLGKRAFDCAVMHQPNCAAAYVLMSGIYAQAGMCHSAKEVEEWRQKAGGRKEAGQSWIEHNQQVHTFFVGERMLRQQQEPFFFHLLQKLSLPHSLDGELQAVLVFNP